MRNLESHLSELLRERAILARKIQQDTTELGRYDRAIAVIQGKSDVHHVSAANEFTSVKPDRYKGQGPLKSAEEYLRDNRGKRIPLSHIVEMLVTAGADPGKPRRGQDSPARLIAHTLRISIPTKPVIFDWEPKVPNKKGEPKMPLSKKVPDEKVMVWLADTADLPNRRKRPH